MNGYKEESPSTCQKTVERGTKPMSISQNVSKEVQKYVLWHYGNLISAEVPRFDTSTKTWIAELKADYPRLILNDSTSERFVKILSIRQLGTISLSSNLKFLGSLSTPRDECVQTLRSYLNIWKERVETIVVEASSMQFARLSATRVFLNPILMILSNFMRSQDLVLSNEELMKLRPDRISQYLSLLEDIELVRKTERGYTYGNMFTELRKSAENDSQFETFVMAFVIRESYPLLREVFEIAQLESFIHLDNCYYRPALEAEKILHKKPETLFNDYLADYRPESIIKLRHTLHQLIEVDALRREGDYYRANEELFDKMLDMKAGLQEISPPRA